MSQPSDRIAKFLILFVIGIFLIKNFTGSGFFEPTDHKGKGYYVKIPKGWSKVKKEKGTVYPQGVTFVQFVPEGVDLKVARPDAMISIYSKKLITPIWIEDEFTNIVQSLREEGYEVKDQGQIKVDEKIAGWVVYFDRKTPALNLEFYIVSENNMFYKMQYSADPDKFQENRHYFEELKNSFKFRFSLY